jgi:hypothetical protein
MPASRGTYVVSIADLASGTAIKTLIQIKAGAANPLELIRARLAQDSSTVSSQQRVEVCRKTAAATVTPFTPKKLGPANDPAAAAVGGTAATGVNASVEGTDGDALINDVWNSLIGFYWSPVVPAEKIYVDAAGIIAMRLPEAPGGSMDLSGDLVFQEL